MKRILILIALVACQRNETRPAETTHPAPVANKQAEVWTCPMHPQIAADKPGKCPICGMTLVKKTATVEASYAHGLETIALSPEQRITANVHTTTVVLDTHTGEIVTTGRVTFDERRIAQVTAYAAGRIEKMFVNFTGDSVRRGQAVASFYSPDLFSTQQEYLLAIENRERMRRAGFEGARSASEDLLESTRRRLMLFGMTASQVAQLQRTRKPIFATNIISPVSGVVTKKLVIEQQYVEQGQPLLEVADVSSVWVEADVYEQQLPQVQLGQKVEITSAASPGANVYGKVAFIQPVLAGASRTASVRIDLPNPALRLKPDMYVNVRIFGFPMEKHIMVPPSAVVDRGQKQFVWVEKSAGTYEPREVRTGGRHGEAIVIVSGVEPGERIVVDGAFLLDSEAQLRAHP